MKKINALLIALLLLLSCISTGTSQTLTPAQAIIAAAREGDLAAIRALLEQDPGLVRSSDTRHCTPLHFAADTGNGEAAGLLLDHGAALEARDADGDTPLFWAAIKVHDDLVGLLIARGADVKARNGNNETALHYAVRAGSTGAAAALLEHGAEIDAQRHDQSTPLHRAVLGNHSDLVKLLLEKGAGTEIRESYGRTPLLHVARETGDAGMASILIDAGADINATDRFGETPLDLAAWRGFREIVQMLLDRGAKVTATGERGEMLVINAATKGLPELFTVLRKKGANLRIRNDKGGSLLHSAAMGGSREIVELLLDMDLDVDEADRYGWTPLHYAADMGRTDVVGLLIGRGADLDERTFSGKTPFNLASAKGRPEVIPLLEANGAAKTPQRFPVLKGRYMGQKPPGRVPEIFAPDVVSLNDGEHGNITFSPDGKEAYWSSNFMIADSGYSEGGILWSRLENGRWTIPKFPHFALSLEESNDVPFISPDGKKLFFLSRRPLAPGGRGGPERIWVVDKAGSQESGPRPLGQAVNSMNQHWQISVSGNETLYFSSDSPGGRGMGDIYVSRLVDGQYTQPVNLGDPINTEHSEGTPYIAPDESYLLFSRTGQDDGIGAVDLYASFRDEEGNWTLPRNMGASVNSAEYELCPMVSPDGKYLFFISSRAGQNDIYWMTAGIIEELRRKKS